VPRPGPARGRRRRASVRAAVPEEDVRRPGRLCCPVRRPFDRERLEGDTRRVGRLRRNAEAPPVRGVDENVNVHERTVRPRRRVLDRGESRGGARGRARATSSRPGRPTRPSGSSRRQAGDRCPGSSARRARARARVARTGCSWPRFRAGRWRATCPRWRLVAESSPGRLAPAPLDPARLDPALVVPPLPRRAARSRK